MSDALSLQEEFGPHGICFGCGPQNPKGLRIRSFRSGEGFVLRWRAEEHHAAFGTTVNGGIIGALFDCHCNWAAAIHLMDRHGREHPPATVTAEFHVKLRYPTPMAEELLIEAKVVQASDDRATVEATLHAGGRLCATCRGVFVTVQPGHPAYHTWQ